LRAEVATLRSEAERYRAGFELSASGQVISSLDGRIKVVNDRACAILGHTREALIGKHFSEITHPADLKLNAALLEQLVLGIVPSMRMDKRYLRADGSAVWCAIHVAMVRNAEGEPKSMLAVINDISERKRIESELRERNDVLAGLSAHMPSALFIYKVDERGHRSLPYLSESMSTMFELDLTTLREDATLLAQRIHPDDVHRLAAELIRAADALQTDHGWIMAGPAGLPRLRRRRLGLRPAPARRPPCRPRPGPRRPP
jgi:PAS domain S-box-containing protein